MPTLLDTAEFALAKATLDETLQRIEKARQDRLELVRKYLEMSETELERVKKQALELPALIARYRAEIARLEATTGADILCEAMDALKAECWGSPGEAVEVQSPKPQPEAQSSASAEEPFIPGLPPEALRKAWARAWPMSNETKRELNSQIFAARKVVNSTLECIARWERRNNQGIRLNPRS